MKTEFIDVSDTQKNLVVEIPSTVVDAEIDKVARDYSKAARIPGFRPGKVPAKVVRQRFRDQILHDVAHGLIPRAVDEALRERGVEPVDTPDIKDVLVEEGQPLKFTASFETVPPIEPGDYTTLTLHEPNTAVTDDAVQQALSGLRDRAARYEPVEGRGVEAGDSVVLDLKRTALPKTEEPLIVIPGEPAPPPSEPQTDTHEGVTVEIGAPANPPGFDEQLAGLLPGESKTFDVQYPADYAIQELAGSTVKYAAALKAIRKRVVPELDDEFAKDIGEFETLDALRTRVRGDLEHEAKHEAERELRAELLKQIASRVTFDVPQALLDREIDRRVEDFARRLVEQRIDPMKVNINWEEFREKQKEAAAEAVRGALYLDEVARREAIAASDAEVDAEIARYAERTGRTAQAVRARLEKDGGVARIYSGLRREKAMDFLLSRASRG
ncbi:MAG: trigger factor [Acidobacteria bacterium RIFCSPLOWO2_02_FULL_67_36]|nr:MAG: trigger factor [Acidobacteria bacterium RIFCSPLOWO2_02_FULL_67_36]OFW21720.1 MAG: trigger factor [Acidobacteria bacterium RIFCSPLOWO2_12_FULL_66_21]